MAREGLLDDTGVSFDTDGQTCENCKFHIADEEDWICMNQRSECFGRITEFDDFCVSEFERR